MDINVNEFLRKSTKAYNFQYLDVTQLDRIIRNVKKSSDVQVDSTSSQMPVETKQKNVRMLQDDEIDEILRTAVMDLQEEEVHCEAPTFLADENHELKSEDDEHSDGESTICSSGSSVLFSPLQPDFQHTSDETTADIEDNLIGDEDCAVHRSILAPKYSLENERNPINDDCLEFLDSESIAEELTIMNNESDGDSESESVKVLPVIRVRSPVKPASAIIETYETEDPYPVNNIQTIFDFAAIERSNKKYSENRLRFVPEISSNLTRPVSRKSLVEEFDTFVKITELQKKVCLLIDDIRHCMGKVEEPEDELEERKREKRTAEFLIRFQRNYLYQINRLEEDVCVMARNSFEFVPKVYQLYKLICQGLKFYLKNMKYFVIGVNPEKLWTLGKQIVSSTKVCVQKGIFDEDDLIVDEINEKCHLLKQSLKEEAGRKKDKKNQRKRVKVSNIPSESTVLNAKYSMYGVTTPVQKRRIPTRKSVSSDTKKRSTLKHRAAKQPPNDTTKTQKCGKIITVPVSKSSSSSLGQSKSKTRVRSARTPAGTIDDVVTQVQQQSDPLANSRLLKEVSSALTKMSTSRDAAISSEVNQELRQLIMDTIQNITQQELKHLIPSLEVR
ncbi:uncharacterized protein LOC131425335 [Malaya genurostris]|uniref:uncharacterized protein LOC131425335 n=1 Tax=Malaya genurostris TaxID=325434 RepID=UPI0026F3DB32|nr:uncharacterized protein LOC131425335 [Malaya genurostris]